MKGSRGPTQSTETAMLLAPALIVGSVEEEIEARFLVPKSSLIAAMSAAKVLKIRQFYISSERRPAALKKLLRALPQAAPFLKLQLTTFRLREQRVRGKDAKLYFAQLKTKRSFLSRREVSIPLTAKLFNALLVFADDGFVAKDRIIKSSFFSLAGKRLKVEAHIDDISALGLGKDQLSGNQLPRFLSRYAIVEVELPTKRSYQILKRESWGAFNFVKSGVNLQDLQTKKGTKISFRELSKGRPSKKRVQKEVEKIEKFFLPRKS